MGNYYAQLPALLEGMPNPYINATVAKLTRYKVPHVLMSIELAGRDFVEIREVDGLFARKPRAVSVPKKTTGITSRQLDDGYHLHTMPSGATCVASFPWDEARHWRMVRATAARIDRAMRLGNYGLDSAGKVSKKKLPLKGEIFVGEVAA